MNNTERLKEKNIELLAKTLELLEKILPFLCERHPDEVKEVYKYLHKLDKSIKLEKKNLVR